MTRRLALSFIRLPITHGTTNFHAVQNCYTVLESCLERLEDSLERLRTAKNRRLPAGDKNALLQAERELYFEAALAEVELSNSMVSRAAEDLRLQAGKLREDAESIDDVSCRKLGSSDALLAVARNNVVCAEQLLVEALAECAEIESEYISPEGGARRFDAVAGLFEGVTVQ